MDTEQSTPLTLVSYPADRKVTVIKIVREITGFGLKEAKDLIESPLPALVKGFATYAEAEVAQEKLTAVGAECRAGAKRNPEIDGAGVDSTLPAPQQLEGLLRRLGLQSSKLTFAVEHFDPYDSSLQHEDLGPALVLHEVHDALDEIIVALQAWRLQNAPSKDCAEIDPEGAQS